MNSANGSVVGRRVFGLAFAVASVNVTCPSIHEDQGLGAGRRNRSEGVACTR